MTHVPNRAWTPLAAIALTGAAGLAWSLAEAHRYTMRFHSAAVLRPGTPPRRVLHLSDLHLTPSQGGKRRWLRALAQWEPDLVVITGDFLAHRAAVPVALDSLAPLADFPGVFVLGSNDYYAPTALNPAKYLRGPSQLEPKRPPLPWGDLVAGLAEFGWVELSNRQQTLPLPGWTVAARGVDDPHIGRDRYDLVAGPFPDADLRLGVSHAPYLRVLDALAGDAADLVLAGHTHGGQLCLPGVGALVTNCDLPRRYASGLHRYRPEGGGPATTLHVSAGLGTSPYAPVRFACAPEATLVTLTARD